MDSQHQLSNRSIFLIATGWGGFAGALFFWIAGATGVFAFPFATTMIFVALVLILAPVNGLICVWRITQLRKNSDTSSDATSSP